MKHTRLATLTALALIGAALSHETVRAGDLRSEFQDRRQAIATEPTDMGRAEALRDHYLLGVWAKDKGLTQDARAQFEHVVSLDPDHSAAREALGHVRLGDRWLGLEEAMQAKGLVLRNARWILREEAEILDLPAAAKARRKEEQAKVRKLLDVIARGGERARKFAAESLGTIDDAYKVEPLSYALRSANEDVRTLCADELGRIGNRRALRPLLYRAVHDPSDEVRHASIDAAKAIGDPNLAVPLVTALSSENAQVRMNAADSLGRLGDVRAVKYLVYRFEAHGGGAPRVYTMFASQLTFIQDFDVEVAQTAFIADPIVGVIQEGLVLDVTVVATEQSSVYIEREVVHGALRRLTGASDVEKKNGSWAAWYREHAGELTAAASETR